MTASREVKAVIHLYAPPGDFPATLCGLNGSWGAPYAAVYGHDMVLVNCPACRAAALVRPVAVADIRREPDPVFSVLRVAVPLLALIIAVWWLLP